MTQIQQLYQQVEEAKRHNAEMERLGWAELVPKQDQATAARKQAWAAQKQANVAQQLAPSTSIKNILSGVGSMIGGIGKLFN